MAESMDDILNPPSEPETAEVETEVEQEKPAEVEKEETGVAETQTAAETKEEEPADVKGIKAAMMAERRKRQDTEAKLAQLEAEREAAAKEEKPYLGEEYEQRFTETEQRFNQQLLLQKLDISEDFARSKYADYEEKLELFRAQVEQNPALYQQMIQQVNPAEFAYKTANDSQKMARLKELGDPDEFAAKLRETIKAELKAEAEAEKTAAVEAAIKAKLKGGFSEQRSSGNERTTVKKFNGPTPMSDILG